MGVKDMEKQSCQLLGEFDFNYTLDNINREMIIKIPMKNINISGRMRFIVLVTQKGE